MKRNSRRRALAIVSLLCAVLLAACGDSAPRLRALSITPATATIDNTTTQQFTATAFYSNGSQQDATTTVGWTSSAPTIATISTTGVATAVSNGSTTITATLLGVSATATLTVSRTLLSIAVAPAAKSIALGLTANFTATGTFQNSDGSTGTSDITNSVDWESSNTGTATIDQTGLATSVAVGTTNITASLDSITSPIALLTVTPAVVTGLQVTPASPTLATSNVTDLVAMEVKSDGTTVPLTGPVTWATSGCSPASSTTLASSGTNGTEIAVGSIAGGCTVTATEATLTGTATVTVVPGTAHFAYVANPGGTPLGSVSEFSADATSATPFTPLTPASIDATSPGQVVLGPSGLFAYTADSSSNISIYSVDSGGSGQLTFSSLVTPAPFADGGTNYLVIDPTGRYLYISDALSSAISGYSIDPTAGTLTPLPAVTNFIVNLNQPEDLQFDLTGKFLYVVNSAGTTGTLSAYAVADDGSLAPQAVPTYALGATPFYAAISPNNSTIYVANTGDNTITTYTINGTTGALSGGANTVTTGTGIFTLVVDPTSTYLYVLDTTDGSSPGAILGFTLGADGSVGAAIPGTPIATDVNPFDIVIDPTGTLLAVTGNTGDTLTPFAVDPTTGTPTAGTPVTVGTSPLYVTFSVAP